MTRRQAAYRVRCFPHRSRCMRAYFSRAESGGGAESPTMPSTSPTCDSSTPVTETGYNPLVSLAAWRSYYLEPCVLQSLCDSRLSVRALDQELHFNQDVSRSARSLLL